MNDSEILKFARMVQAEAITLMSRLPDPYRNHQKIVAEEAKKVIAELEMREEGRP